MSTSFVCICNIWGKKLTHMYICVMMHRYSCSKNCSCNAMVCNASAFVYPLPPHRPPIAAAHALPEQPLCSRCGLVTVLRGAARGRACWCYKERHTPRAAAARATCARVAHLLFPRELKSHNWWLIAELTSLSAIYYCCDVAAVIIECSKLVLRNIYVYHKPLQFSIEGKNICSVYDLHIF